MNCRWLYTLVNVTQQEAVPCRVLHDYNVCCRKNLKDGIAPNLIIQGVHFKRLCWFSFSYYHSAVAMQSWEKYITIVSTAYWRNLTRAVWCTIISIAVTIVVTLIHFQPHCCQNRLLLTPWTDFVILVICILWWTSASQFILNKNARFFFYNLRY